jgi:chromosome segregation ATPase
MKDRDTWHEELELAHALHTEQVRDINKLKGKLAQDGDIISDLQQKVKRAGRNEDILKEREKTAQSELEKMRRKGARLVTLRTKVQGLQDENHAYQAELMALQHSSNAQQTTVESDIQRLIAKCKKLSAANKTAASEMELDRAEKARLLSELQSVQNKVEGVGKERVRVWFGVYMESMEEYGGIVERCVDV